MDILAILNRVDDLLKEQGRTKADLYSSCPVSASAVSQWKSGKTTPSVKSLQSIADFLGVQYEYLVAGNRVSLAEEMEGWYPPERFWKKINEDRPRFINFFLHFWEYSIYEIQRLWNISVDDPNAASDEDFFRFLDDVVKAVRLESSGEWDVILNEAFIRSKNNPQADSAPLFSSEALRLARDYDELDEHGQKMVRMVTDEEKKRIDAARPAEPKITLAMAPEPEEEPDYQNIRFAAYGDTKKKLSKKDMDDISAARKAKKELDQKKKSGD